MLNAEPREKVRRGLSALQILVQVLVQFILGEILNAFILQAFIQRKKKNDIRHNLQLPDTMTTHNKAVSLVASRHIWERRGYSHLPLIYLPASPWL